MADTNAGEDDDSGDAMVGPPRPPPGPGDGEDEDGDVMVGPPPPPVGLDQSDEDGEMIGPPKPPPGWNLSDEDEEEDDDEVENRYRIPMSNEIVLKGHTKVFFSFLLLVLFL